MAAPDSKYPLGPYKLVTVNNAPERAKKLIGRVVETVKDKYTIIHAGNADSTSLLFSIYPNMPISLFHDIHIHSPPPSNIPKVSQRPQV